MNKDKVKKLDNRLIYLTIWFVAHITDIGPTYSAAQSSAWIIDFTNSTSEFIAYAINVGLLLHLLILVS